MPHKDCSICSYRIISIASAQHTPTLFANHYRIVFLVRLSDMDTTAAVAAAVTPNYHMRCYMLRFCSARVFFSVH